MKLLEPLGIIPIGLASRHGLDVPRVDQIGSDASLFKQLVDRDPKHTSALQGDRINATGD
jgi:hypothetical protein